MLAIPNTTTTARDDVAGAAVFPSGGDAGALTPFSAGFVFVANNTAQLSIRRGPSANRAQWTPYVLVSPTMVPLSTDRGGRREPDFIFGVKAIDGIAGTHAQVFGALFQAGEAGFVPSAQFAGTVGTSGGFTPPSASTMQLIQQIGPLGAPQAGFNFTSIPTGFTSLELQWCIRGTVAAAADTLLLQANGDTGADYFWQRVRGTAAAVTTTETAAATSVQVAAVPAAAATAALFGTGSAKLIGYANGAARKMVISQSSVALALGAGGNYFADFTIGSYDLITTVGSLNLFPGAGNADTGSFAALFGVG